MQRCIIEGKAFDAPHGGYVVGLVHVHGVTGEVTPLTGGGHAGIVDDCDHCALGIPETCDNPIHALSDKAWEAAGEPTCYRCVGLILETAVQA